MEKVIKTLLIIFFPLGIVYCVGKNLFRDSFACFLGGIFLCAIGAALAIYFLRPDIVQQIIEFFMQIVKH